MRRIALVAIAAVALTASFYRPARAEGTSLISSLGFVATPPAGVLVGERAIEPSRPESPVLCCSAAPLVARLERLRQDDERGRFMSRTVDRGVAWSAGISALRLDTKPDIPRSPAGRHMRRARSYALVRGLPRRVCTVRRDRERETLAELLNRHRNGASSPGTMSVRSPLFLLVFG